MRITIIPPAGPLPPMHERRTQDVELTVCEPTAAPARGTTWGDLAVALFGATAAEGVDALIVDGRRHRLRTSFEATLVHPGSVVACADPAPPRATATGPQPGQPVAELRVVGGLDAGRRTAVTAGRHVVGRDPSGALVLGSPTVSRQHAVIDLDPGGRATVTDLDATNGLLVGAAHRTSFSTSVSADARADELLTLGAVALRLAPVDAPVDDARGAARDGGGAAPSPPRVHNRPPRLLRAEEPTRLALPGAPRAVAGRTPFSWAMLVAPLLVGGLMARLFSPVFAVFALLSPLLMVASWLEQRRRGNRERHRLGREHRARLERFADDLTGAVQAHGDHLHRTVPDLVTISERATRQDPRLWERRPAHPDFGVLRVGRATRPWSPPFAGDLERALPDVQEIVTRCGVLPDAPVTTAIGRGRVIGLVGPPEATVAVARSLVVQAAILHGPADLWLAMAAPSNRAHRWGFVSWLPHHQGAPVAARSRCCTSEADLRSLISELPREPPGSAPGSGPFGLVVIDAADGERGVEGPSLVDARRLRPPGPPAGDARRALVRALQPAHCAVVVGHRSEELPAECTTVIECLDELGSARVLEPATGTSVEGVVLDGMSEGLASTVARQLTAVEDPLATDGTGGLPSTVHLRALLDDEDGGARPDRKKDRPRALLHRWQQHRDGSSLRAVVGVGAEGPHHIDLVADGPHALIGGTTGSGKSELLRSWVVSLACTYAPDELTFVLIDYKGGSAFDACAQLPHVVGMVTDLDPRLGERALRSLDAELRNREQRLRDAGASDFLALHATGSAPGRLPRLVVIIDEFATLAADVPGFLDALVGVAQRGRSLGVHLVLATQRPHGAINDNIRTNTNLRIALRMLDATDSIDVLGARDASAIDRRTPGRAVCRVGGEPVVAWQAAHLPAAPACTRTTAAGGDGDAAFVAVALDPFGRPLVLQHGVEVRPGDTCAGQGEDDTVRPASPRSAMGSSASSPPGAAGSSELGEIVAEVQAAFVRSGLEEPARPWLPPLPPIVPVAALHPEPGPPTAPAPPRTPHGDPDDGDAGRPIVVAPVPLGLTDEPDLQRQRIWRWDPLAGPLVVYGMPGSGKTGAVLAVIDGLARAHPSADCHVYVIGVPSKGLGALADQPQVGAVIWTDDQERVRRLLRWLDERRRRGGQPGGQPAGAASPAVVVIVDGATALLHALDDLEGRRLLASFTRLASEGPRAGIHLVVTGDRPQSVPAAVAAATDAKVVLRLPDLYDYSLLGLRVGPPKAGPGRGVLADGTEIQLGFVESPRSPASGAGTAATEAGARTAPVRIGVLPERVARRDLPPASATSEAWTLPVGIDDATLGPLLVELRVGDHLLLAGPPGSGRTTALLTLGCAFEHAGLGRVSVLSSHPNALTRAFPHHATTPTELFARLARAAADDRDGSGRQLVLVDDADRLADPRLEHLVGTALPWIRVVAAGRADRLRHDFTHWTRPMRSGRHGLALDATVAADGELWGVRLVARPDDHARPGRAAFIRDGRATTTQVACP